MIFQPALNKTCCLTSPPPTHQQLKHPKLQKWQFSQSSQFLKRTLSIFLKRSLSVFKKNLLNFIRPCTNSIFNIHNPYGIKLPTRLRLGLSHLRDHKFRHCFQDTLNPLCDCGNDTETTTHFFLHCPSFHTPRQTRLNNIRKINEQILSHSEDQLIQTFLYGNHNFNLTVNRLILNATIECLISKERFKCPLFN